LVYDVLRGWNHKSGNYDAMAATLYQYKYVTITEDPPSWLLRGSTEPDPENAEDQTAAHNTLWIKMEDPQFETLGTGPPTAENPISILRVLSRHKLDWFEMLGIFQDARYDALHSESIIGVVPNMVGATTASKHFFCTLQDLYHYIIFLRDQVLS
jgi:hypothetical protein